MRTIRPHILQLFNHVLSIFPTSIPISVPSNLITKRIFILSAGRSGSTLLAALLDNHPEITIPNEQYVLPKLILWFKLLNYYGWNGVVKKFSEKLAAPSSTLQWGISSEELYEVFMALPKKERSLQSLIDAMYLIKNAKSQNGIACWGDKTPMTTDYIQMIKPVFPDAKYIGLIRDGRDVVASSWTLNNKSLTQAAHTWNRSIKQLDWIKKHVPEENLLIVKYETLVRKPDETAKSIFEFLGFQPPLEAYKPGRYLDQMGEAGKIHAFSEIGNPITDAHIGKWQTTLPTELQTEVFPILNSNLEKLGYLAS